MDLAQIVAILRSWARDKSLIKRVYVFGSRVRGEQRPDSDLDVAIELDRTVIGGSDESGGLATWMFEAKGWTGELEKLIPLRVQVERYHPDQTPTVAKGLAQSSQLVYEKAI